jgi:hypothetical protein
MIVSKSITPQQAARHPQARYLFDYLTAIGAQTIIAEYDYTDAAYLDDFAHFYVKSFSAYDRRCRRLHFFRRLITKDDLLSWALGAASTQPFRDDYLGFVVVRPLPQAVIGRTALATYPADGGRRHYPVVLPYEAHLFGATLEVQSLAFQEQDTVLAACATVALWSAFQKCARMFGTLRPSPAEITAMATSGELRSRALPSPGLTLAQMCRAIKTVGLEPEVFECTPSTPLNSLLHAYVGSGLPVILVVEIEKQGHAVTLAGFSLRPNRCVPREDMVAASPPLHRIGLRIDEWYGHDDQVGPFAHVFTKPYAPPVGTSASVIAFDGTWRTQTGDLSMLIPKHVIVPVYHKIRVTFMDVQKWVVAFNRLAQQVIQNFDELEWDVRLTTTNDLKEALRALPPSPARNRILLRPLPRFIWRAVFQTPLRPAAEILFDATDMARSYPFVDVLFHDDDFRPKLRTILHEPGLHDILAELVTPQFRDFLRKGVD